MLTFDHVALAAGNTAPLQRFLAGRNGGVVIGGGSPPGSGFRAMQFRMGRGEVGMTIELLEPWDVHVNDFLDRFLVAGGPRPHHFTFKTPDIRAELERFQGLGFEPVGVNFSNEHWQEFFIHPKRGHGPVIQIAQPGGERPPMPDVIELAMNNEFEGWGTPWWEETDVTRGSAASTLEQVVIHTNDLDAGVAFYGDVLGGVINRTSRTATVTWTGGTVTLELADVTRPRIDRLEMSGDAVAEVRTVDGTTFVAV